MIVKICQIHGELSADQVKQGVYRGKKYKKCKQCEQARGVEYHKRLYADPEKAEAKRAKDRAYWAENKEKVSARRQLPERQAKRRETYKANQSHYNRNCKEKQQKYRDELHDHYIKKLIQNGDKSIKWEHIPPALVEFKRSLMQLKTTIKKQSLVRRLKNESKNK